MTKAPSLWRGGSVTSARGKSLKAQFRSRTRSPSTAPARRDHVQPSTRRRAGSRRGARKPATTTSSPARSSSRESSRMSNWRSASVKKTCEHVAAPNPARRAAPYPCGGPFRRTRTRVSARAATSAVPSEEPSSTTMISPCMPSASNAETDSATQTAMLPASLRAGSTMLTERTSFREAYWVRRKWNGSEAPSSGARAVSCALFTASM